MVAAQEIRGFRLRAGEEQPAAWPARLPSGLELLAQLIAVSRKSSEKLENSRQFIALIRLDKRLARNVLQCCRSIHHCRIDSLNAAVIKLGSREVCRVAAGVSAGAWFSRLEQRQPGAFQLWEHALHCAVASYVIAEHSGLDSESAYTAGLFHDIGKALLWQEFGDEYLEMMAHCIWTDGNLPVVERNRFGIEHAAIGGRLLSEWRFPREIAAAVAEHHHPNYTRANLAGILAVANSLVHSANRTPRSSSVDNDPFRAVKSEIISRFHTEWHAFQQARSRTGTKFFAPERQ